MGIERRFTMRSASRRPGRGYISRAQYAVAIGPDAGSSRTAASTPGRLQSMLRAGERKRYASTRFTGRPKSNRARILSMPTPSSTHVRTTGLSILAVVIALLIVVSAFPLRAADKRIVLIAGKPSHPPGMHEFRAGCLLLQKALSSFPGVTVQVYDLGWPAKMVDGARVEDSSALDNADAVLIFADGGKGNPAIQGDHT